jgi:predicted nucleic acid-binding protein
MGLTVLDADVLIGVLTRTDANHRKARRAMERVLTEVPDRVISAVTVAEITVGPMARGDEEGNAARLFIEGLRATVLPLDADRARHAAAIRARTGVKLPDACVLAAALEMEGRQPEPVTITSFDKRLLGAWKRLSRAA